MDAEAAAYYIKQRFPNLPIILISAYSEIPEKLLWLVDEYVMKSEMPEGLVRVIKRATHCRLTPAVLPKSLPGSEGYPSRAAA
jgi:two-component SAPR family response regulator